MPHSGRTKCSLWLMLIVGSAVAISASPSRAQQPCTTTVECAQAAVTAAAKAQEATKSLDERIKKVEQNKWTIDCVTVGNTAADHRTANVPFRLHCHRMRGRSEQELDGHRDAGQ